MKERIQKLKESNKGFTLMEMIIVVAIIAILVALIAPNLTGFLSSATTTSNEANAKSCYTAASAWATQEKIDGHTVTSTTITVTKTGATGVTVSGTDADATTKLETDINCANFGAGTATITLDGGVVTKVVWDPDGVDSDTETPVTYPKA